MTDAAAITEIRILVREEGGADAWTDQELLDRHHDGANWLLDMVMGRLEKEEGLRRRFDHPFLAQFATQATGTIQEETDGGFARPADFRLRVALELDVGDGYREALYLPADLAPNAMYGRPHLASSRAQWHWTNRYGDFRAISPTRDGLTTQDINYRLIYYRTVTVVALGGGALDVPDPYAAIANLYGAALARGKFSEPTGDLVQLADRRVAAMFPEATA